MRSARCTSLSLPQSVLQRNHGRLGAIRHRTDLLDDLAYPSGAYLYAQAIPLPEVASTDFLFENAGSSTGQSRLFLPLIVR